MAAIYFTLIVLIGSFFALNLVLAVLESAFDSQERAIEEAACPSVSRHRSVPRTVPTVSGGGGETAPGSTPHQVVLEEEECAVEDVEELLDVERAPRGPFEVCAGLCASLRHHLCRLDVHGAAQELVLLERFDHFFGVLVVVNIVVLSLDHKGIS